MIERVGFHSWGKRLSGRLHRPASPPPWAVVVQPPGWMETVCSNVSEPFHRALAAAGYAVFQFNGRGWEDSEGEPGWIRPADQVEDLLNALTYVETRPDLDSGRVGLFGVGGTGAGNALIVAAIDPRPRCVVVQNVVADGPKWFRGMRREHEWIEFQSRVQANQRQRVLENVDEIVDPTEELMVATPARRTAGMPTFGRTFHLGSAEALMRYRPLDVVERIAPRGLLLTCIDDDPVTPRDHALEIYERARPPKRLVRQINVGSYEAYTKNFDLLMQQFLEWYRRFLGEAGRVTTTGIDSEVVLR